MSSKKEMTRKDFLTLTFTLIGTTAVGVAACSDNNNAADGGTAGTTGTGGTSTGRGGTGGTGGSGARGGAGGTTGTGGAGGNVAASCMDPLPESQVSDTTGHTHTVTIAASALDATSAQTFDTSNPVSGTSSPHMHMVTLQPADLAMLKAGGTVTMTSTIVMSHAHMYMISCH
jgi:hypothetical protein